MAISRRPTHFSSCIALLPLNIFRLRQMLALVRQVGDATKGDLNMDWLKPFTTSQSDCAGRNPVPKRRQSQRDDFRGVRGVRIPELKVPIGPGQVIGELGLLSPDQIRTQSMDCVKDADVLRITYDQVRQLYFQNPKFGFYFLQLTSRRLFENVERLEKRLADRAA